MQSQAGVVCSSKASKVQTAKVHWTVFEPTRVDCPCVREDVYIFTNFIMISFFVLILLHF